MADRTRDPAAPAARTTGFQSREWLKAAARMVALVAVSPFLVWHKLWSLVIGPDRASKDRARRSRCCLDWPASTYAARFWRGPWPSAHRPQSSVSASCSRR